MTLSVDVRTGPAGQVVIALRGDLDQNTAGQVRDAVTAALATHQGAMCLDVSLMAFVDSSGLGVMISAYKACKEQGRPFQLEGVSPAVYQRLHVSGLTDLFGLTAPRGG